MPPNLNFTREDVAKAREIKKSWEQRFEKEPVFDHARQTLEKAKQFAPEDNRPPLTAARRNREAFDHLKASLASIRSKGESFFNETIPATRGESTFKVLVASDSVDQSLPHQDPPTSITGNIRPHNAESYRQAKEIFLEGTEDEIKDRDAVGMGVRLKIKLVQGYSEESLAKIIAFVEKLVPPPVRARLSIQSDENKEHVIITFVRDGNPKKDPINKLIKALAKATTKGSGEFASETSAVDLLRLATLRIDIPHDLSEWLRDETKSKQSWVTLLEGVRIAVEAITRDASSVHAYPDIALNVLKSGKSNARRLMKGLVMTGLMQMSRESSLHVKVPPAELLFALGVETAAEPNRLAFLSKIAASLKGGRPTVNKEHSDYKEVVEAIEEYLASTAPEELLAATMGSKFKIGASGDRIFQILQLFMGMIPVERGGRAAPLFEVFLPLKDIIEEVSSVEFLSPSGSANLEIKGINRKIWSWVPNTMQECVDNMKHLALASSAQMGFDENGTFIAKEQFNPVSRFDKEDDPANKPIERGPISDEDLSRLVLGTHMMVKPDETFVAGFEHVAAPVMKAVYPPKFNKKCPPHVMETVSLPSIQKPTPRTSCSSEDVAVGISNANYSSAWDIPLPRDLTRPEEGIEAGSKVIDLKMIGKGKKGIMMMMMAQAQKEQREEAERKKKQDEEKEREEAERNMRRTQQQQEGETTRPTPAAATGKFTRGSDGLREGWEEEEAKIFSSQEERDEVRKIFDNFDEDGSNSLDKTEAMAAFLSFPALMDASAAELLRLVRESDTDGNGTLDFIEFAKIAVMMKKKQAERRSRR